ncbi:MAG TPA: helix-turn-helix transcriptional regulator [Candidatus Dormibacteraeota bacterium]|nr:helix-turn-helix transcriptional regulator [Candidatus Dormibacteraeota bacterium]
MRSPAIQAIWLRPYALSHQPLEVPIAAICILGLSLVFIADISTPIEVAVSALGLLPLLSAIWLLSRRLALLVSSVAVGQLLVSGFLGTLSPITVASETTAYVVLGLAAWLIANSLSQLLSRSAAMLSPTPGAVPTSRPNGSGPAAARLTNREQQVARLAADGYTAREIGDQLHIGKRTVETHLANAYEKLGVRSKRELVHSRGAGVVRPSLDA